MDQPFGGFTEEALEAYLKALADQTGIDFSEGDTYDFTRCVRPDGSSYGTGGKCRKGAEAGPKEGADRVRMKELDNEIKSLQSMADKSRENGFNDRAVDYSKRASKLIQERADLRTKLEAVKKPAARTKAQFNKEEMENPKNQADMDHEGLKKLMAKSPTAQRKLKEDAAKKSATSGMRDSSVAESRKAMKHQREQMNLHGNKIAELEDAGKKVPPALRAKYDLAKASYNSHRKAINAATGVEKSPVMQAAREAGRAEEKKNQEKRAIQRGEERIAQAGAVSKVRDKVKSKVAELKSSSSNRDRALNPKEQAAVDAKLGRKPGPSKVAEGLQREQMRADGAARKSSESVGQKVEKLKAAEKAAKDAYYATAKPGAKADKGLYDKMVAATKARQQAMAAAVAHLQKK